LDESRALWCIWRVRACDKHYRKTTGPLSTRPGSKPEKVPCENPPRRAAVMGRAAEPASLLVRPVRQRAIPKALDERPRREDFKLTSSFAGIVLHVPRDQALRSTCQSNLQERLVVGVGKPDRERSSCDRNATCPDLLEQSVNALGIEAEFPAPQDFLILDQNPQIVTKSQIAGSHQRTIWPEGPKG
jgi:hypothetical protein